MREETAGHESSELRAVARLIEDSVPALVRELSTLRPGRVHHEALVLLERPLLLHALALTGGNQLRAARLLGLNRNTLRKRCRELQLVPARRDTLDGGPRRAPQGPHFTRTRPGGAGARLDTG